MLTCSNFSTSLSVRQHSPRLATIIVACTVYDHDTRLNHAAEASQVDLHRPHGARSLANISKEEQHSSSLLFGFIPYSQPPCLIACGPISSISKDPLYGQGSGAGICTSDDCRAGTSLASSLVILPGSQAQTVKLHKGVEGVRQSSSAHRGLRVPLLCNLPPLTQQWRTASLPSAAAVRI